jgi:hypothetical protein
MFIIARVNSAFKEYFLYRTSTGSRDKLTTRKHEGPKTTQRKQVNYFSSWTGFFLKKQERVI